MVCLEVLRLYVGLQAREPWAMMNLPSSGNAEGRYRYTYALNLSRSLVIKGLKAVEAKPLGRHTPDNCSFNGSGSASRLPSMARPRAIRDGNGRSQATIVPVRD